MFSRSAEAKDYFTEYDVEELDGWLAELNKDKVPPHVEATSVQEDQADAETPRGHGRHRGHRKSRLHFMRN